jgi:endo-1,4-beta-xylanase
VTAYSPRPVQNLPLTRRALLQRGAVLAATSKLAGLTAIASAQVQAQAQGSTSLAHAWRDTFHMGVAVSNPSLDRQIASHLDLIAREFNSVTAENAMKWGVLRPDGVNWQWQRPDAFMDFADAHDMYVVGHTLVWHSQIPASVFADADGATLSRDALLARMEEHIATLAGRYRGRVHAWDVVNEAIDEGNGWRRSPWLQIIGEDFMEHAFRMARAADPQAVLLYNDYNMHNPRKRAFLVDVLRDYLDRGVPIDGVGLQGHLGLEYPDMEEWERSIATYADMGLDVHVTELEIDPLPSPYAMSAEISNRFDYSPENDPWPDGLPDEVQQQLADRYEQVFRILLRYRDNVRRVTFWGLHDGISWKNDFPIRGRTNHPLLFDRMLAPKPAYHRLVSMMQ